MVFFEEVCVLKNSPSHKLNGCWVASQVNKKNVLLGLEKNVPLPNLNNKYSLLVGQMPVLML